MITVKYIYDGSQYRESSKKGFSIEFQDRILKIEEIDYEPEFHTLTPAFIDAHSHIGLERWGECYEEGDVNDRGDSIVVYADVLDSIQMDDPSFRDSIENGVLYSSVMPGSGNLISGKAVNIRNFASNTNKAFISYAGYKMALGYNPKSTEDWKGTRYTTRHGIVSLFRQELIKAQNILKLLEKGKKEREELEPDELFFVELLEGKERLRVHLHHQDDLMALLRLGDHFQFNYTVEHGMDFYTKEPFEELKKRNVPLVYGPLDSFAYKGELKHENWRNIKWLKDGPLFSIMSDHPVILQRNLFLSLRWFLRIGFNKSSIISLITKNAAQILGLKDLGEIKEGKWASFSLWDGDPFSLESSIVEVYGEGEKIWSL